MAFKIVFPPVTAPDNDDEELPDAPEDEPEEDEDEEDPEEEDG